MAFPSLYNLFAVWSGPEERATLMSLVFSGISFANMINLPFSAGLCATGIDGGWPMVFYVPGTLGILILGLTREMKIIWFCMKY